MIMKLINISDKYIGHWKGTHRLILSWLPEPDFNSVSNMVIKAAANSKFLMLSYDWIHEDVVQEGILLIGNNNKQSEVTASWIDSWGMGGKIMNCYGRMNEKGDISILGSYEVANSTNWGWRMEIPVPTDNNFQIKMYNVSPDGEESLAVDANYTPV
jgi:hypothetical protein